MTSQTTAPAIIHKLVETFEQNLDSYRSSKNETELRREFLDKFFTALGWDVSNEKGYDELGKEVIHEFSVDVAGQQKKADYAFRVGRGDKFDFLVEAKKPSVKVETSQEAAFQIRRYGWSAKLPINILSDFEHFAVYDCRTKPSYNDKASMGRIMLIHYKDYVSRWNEIVEIFSPEAVRKGSFAKYAEGMKGKKGTADVDDAFLQEIERWRELLAKNIALRNENIDIAGLNYSVQMTIDRIVFLRICEERGIEPENQLLEITNTDKVYEELCELFKLADTKYNSGLFHFKNEKEVVSRPDDLTLSLEIDDKILKDIISNLYYPKSPYAFLYIPSDILGQVYERFLGKVIRLTAGHSAKVEEKPEVRKAGGVYYTPTYIVEYIVKNTVGKLVENKSPKDVASLKIVDPACGSGTFLLGAYQFLLDWHLNWYIENEPEKAEKSKTIVKVGDGYRLTTAKKKEILLNNIHGVDIDAQAVEVTKLSLLLKVLENASGQLGLGIERVLPDLGNNIKCGNSLVGFDYFEGQLFPNEEERTKVNPFNWRNEFKEVYAKNGFDVVIGNPPYIPIFDLDKDFLTYFSKTFQFYEKRYDSYAMFIEKVIKSLLRNDGYLGYIIPSSLLNNLAFANLRKYLVSTTTLKAVRVLGGKVFVGVNKDTMTLILQKNTYDSPVEISYYDSTPAGWGRQKQNFSVKNSELLVNDEFSVSEKSEKNLIDSIFNKRKTISLSSICKSYQGIVTGSDNVFIVRPDEKITLSKTEASYLKDFLFGGDIARYRNVSAPQKIIYLNRHDSIKDKPNFETRIGKDKDKLSKRRETKQGKIPWYALHWGRDYKIFEQPKILVQGIRNLTLPRRIVATFDDTNSYAGVNLSIINLLPNCEYSLFYVLGIINSSAINYLFRHKFVDHRIKNVYLDSIPIREINFSDKSDKLKHEKMISLVEQVLESQKALAKAKTPQEKESLERQIQEIDSSIDSLVYDLYGLNEEEIKILEGQ
jgi:type I restriction-modification system DNA methylase subunit